MKNKKVLAELNRRVAMMSLPCAMAINVLLPKAKSVFIEKSPPWDDEIVFIDVHEHFIEELKSAVDACNSAVNEDDAALIVIADLWPKGHRGSTNTDMMWFGRGGRRRADTAVRAEYKHHGQWEVTQYNHASHWDDPDDMPGKWNAQSVWVKAYSARQAASIGTKSLSYRGGDEEWVDELPW